MANKILKALGIKKETVTVTEVIKPLTFKVYRERHIYFFVCSNCDILRQSFKRAKARRGICRKCRSKNAVHKDQLSLIGDGYYGQEGGM
jgi:transcription initiation factor IIE alpha subunit